MSLTVWADSEAQAQAAAAQIEQRINTLSNALSRQVAASTLAQLNAANGQPVTLDADAYSALEKAVQYAELTAGAFDPTTAPLSDLWGIGTEQAAVPAESAIQQTLSQVGYQQRLCDRCRIWIPNAAFGTARRQYRRLWTKPEPERWELGHRLG